MLQEAIQTAKELGFSDVSIYKRLIYQGYKPSAIRTALWELNKSQYERFKKNNLK